VKISASGDWHLDATTAGASRLDDFDAWFEKFAEVSTAERVDMIALLGDFFDPGGMRAHELTSRLFRYVDTLAGIAPVVVVAGNHDVVETSEAWTTLSPLRVANETGWHRDRVHIFERPFYAPSHVQGVRILAMPYTARAARWTEYDAGRSDFVYACELQDAAIGQAKRSNGVPLVVLSHMTQPGAKLGSESAEMSRGRDLDFPADDVATLGPALVLQGHYHLRQVVRRSGLDIVVTGSPSRFTFGEAQDARKGFVIAEV